LLWVMYDDGIKGLDVRCGGSLDDSDWRSARR
jgi:hypothetical protein